MTPIASLIRSAPITAATARGDWTGKSERAKFEGARAADKSRKVTFGRCVRR